MKRSNAAILGAGMFITTLLSSTALAQVSTLPERVEEAEPADARPADADDVVVTGTRIRRPGLESNSPLTAVGSEEIRYQGAVTAEAVLNRLPQFTADANENVSNGSDGTANVNLRNLGSNRVLVLINGQRMLPQQAVDLNFVPSALIERVDVVSGGASAVYGSDALSGVVNFILRDNLDGFRLDAQAGFAQHTNDNSAVRGLLTTRGYQLAPRRVADGGKQDVNVAFGKNFADGRGNITLYGGYRHFDPVVQSSRDVSSCALNALDAEGTALTCGGSSNTPFGTFVPLAGPNQSVTLTNAKDGSRTWVPYDSSFAYNFSPTNYFQRADERYTGGAFARFKIAEAAELYGSFMYMKDHSFSQAAPSALFLGTTFNVPCNSPLASVAQLSALCGQEAGTAALQPTLIGYRLTVAPRRDNLRHEDYRYTAGLRGNLGSGFSYDVSFLQSRVKYDETYLNNVDSVKAQRALDVVSVGGVPTCRSVVNRSDPSCIPANVFQANAVTLDQANYMFSPSNTGSRNRQTVIAGTVNGDLGELGITSPWAKNGPSVVLGAEHRRESLFFFADEVAQQGGATNSDGRIEVNEGFGEIEIPIVQGQPFFQDLSVNGAVRYSAYKNRQGSPGFSSSFNVWTYKGELSWSPVQDLRLRASYNHAIRAPNIGELFASQAIGNVAAQDPCSGPNPAASASLCQLTGVSAAQYGKIIACPADVCSALGGGNRALKPETGDTYTVGLVLTPRRLKSFSLSVDYFHIKVSDYIGSVDPSLTISQCFSTSDPFFCNLLKRDPRSGALFGTDGYIVSTTLNTGYLKTSGIDVTADYTLGLGGVGRVNLNLVGTWLAERVSEPLPGLGNYDCKGLYGYTCGQPLPEWRHVMRTTWMIPGGATLSASWRHLGSTRLSSLTDDPFFNTNPPSVINRRIKTYNYLDLAGTVQVGEGFTLRAGVNNLFDKDPPAIAAGILSAFGNGNTYPGVYDPLGRTIFAGATINF
ncbi:TonB-dependent Receptor Plug Domain [Sphingomonas gellani]|uniref:TonB-dependent Receptor Plug Domain n=1 Tax=Sphingomonas gellani TaxID=1166340 RepID=A0A1H8IJI8_9SPHN|nr:TonB-dependent receptor [Sphingomonas gellani]SEN68531.1 TonB-dependent Receptor Plug Domain [Sphingomonas gellani]